MEFASTSLKGLITSPPNFQTGAHNAEAAFGEWNAIHAEAERVVLLPVRSETSVFRVDN